LTAEKGPEPAIRLQEPLAGPFKLLQRYHGGRRPFLESALSPKLMESRSGLLEKLTTMPSKAFLLAQLRSYFRSIGLNRSA
jgi:hypothetical protein